MNRRLHYGNVALGVECALPPPLLRLRRRRVRWFLERLAVALRRWG
jgi:hypothetical protein